MLRCGIAVLFVFFATAGFTAQPQEVNYDKLMETIRQKDIKFADLKSSILSLDELCKTNVESKKRASNDIKVLLNATKIPLLKANLLTALLDAKNLCRDQRQLRQWIDELNEILEEEKLPSECRNQCLLAIGEEEFLTGNLVEAEKALCQLIDATEDSGNEKQLAEGLDALEYVYLCKGDRRMFDHIFKKKMLLAKHMTSYTNEQSEVYASSAMKCALLRDWMHFDDLCERSSKIDGGKMLCQSLIPLLFANMNAVVGKDIAKQVALKEMKASGYTCQLWTSDESEIFEVRGKEIYNHSQFVRNAENNYAVSDFVRTISGRGFSLVEFNKISKTIQCHCAGESIAQTVNDDVGLKYLLKLIEIEVKIGNDVSCVNLRDELKQLEPKPFKILQSEFSVKDAELLLLLVKMCVSQRLGDLAESGALAQKLEITLDGTSKQCATLLSDECQTRIAEVLIDQGKVKDGYNLLFPIGEKKLKSDTFVDVPLYYNLGRACRRLGALGDAEVLLSKAYHFVRPGGYSRPHGYDTVACFYGADVCTELAMLLAAKKASRNEIDNLIDEAVGFALKGGHPDALGRAYQEAMKNLFNNSDMSRKEKLAKIEKMKGDCLAATSNPALLASFFYNSAKFEYINNMSAKKIVKEIEQYFHYQQLFAGLTETASPSSCDSEMREMLLTLLGEMDDAIGLDYWNKIFEKRKTRSVEMASMASCQGEKSHAILPLIAQISKYEAAKEILTREQSKPEDSRDQVLLAKATKIKRELEHNFDEAQKTLSPDNAKRLRDLLADSFVIHPDSMGQLCSVLPDDVVCLQFLSVGEKIVVYLVAKGATPFVTTIQLKDKGLTGKKLTSNVVKLRSKIQNGVPATSLEKDMKALYDVLFSDIKPVMERLKCKRVIVNSSGMLRYIPFSALYDGEKYLVEQYQISNVTGLDLVRLAKTQPTRNVNAVRAMIFADPDGSLPSGREEGKKIAGMFTNSQLLVGGNASIGNFESMLGNVNFIHLATHAVLDSDNPKNSFILFADGCQWRYCDMMGFCVENIDSIVLSACSTAVGEKSNGGEIEGMAYQLLRKSPSGSVLASFWKVDDAATEKLMSVYYNHISKAMKERGLLDRGGALHEAQLALLHSPETASPYYWAAFSLFGDFR